MDVKGTFDLLEEHLTIPAGQAWTRYLLRWTQSAERELARRDATRVLTSQFAPSGRRLLLFVLFRRLISAATPALGAEIDERLRALGGLLVYDVRLATSEQRSRVAQELLSDLEVGAEDGPLARVPLLAPLLDRLVAQFVDMALELAGRLACDRVAIVEALFGGVDPGPVTAVSSDGADAHRHGHVALVLTFRDGRRCFYKPHDCMPDVLFASLASRVLTDDLVVPRTLARGGYGWCEFVKCAPASSEADVRAYFLRLGRSFALLQALGSADLHVDNWLACGARPALVDLETILSPVPRVFNDETVSPDASGSAEDDFLRDLNLSLIPSCLLPSSAGGVEFSVMLADGEGQTCLPELDGRRVSVLGYEDVLIKGFSEGYDRCRAARDGLRAAVQDFSGTTIRRLVRNTNFYAQVLTRMQGRRALTSREEQEGIAARVEEFFVRHGARHMLPIARFEEKCMMRGDVPYFCTRADGLDLCGDDASEGGVVMPDFFERSAVEAALERIDRLSEAERDFEAGILRESLRMALVHVPESEGAPSTSADAPCALEAGEALAEAVTLFEDIEARLLTGPSGARGWIARNGELEALAIARPGLAQGTGGYGVLFAALVGARGVSADVRRRARELAELCLDRLELTLEGLGRARIIAETAIPFGVTDGLGGALVSLAHMERRLRDGRARELAARIFALLDRADIEGAKQPDAYAGLAGLILGIDACIPLFMVGDAGDARVAPEAELALRGAREATRRASARLLELRALPDPTAADGPSAEAPLLWDTLGKGRPAGGAAHGMIGIAAALLAASDLTGDSTLAGPALDALAFEHRTYSEKLGTWPDFRVLAHPSSAMHGLCSGAPGEGLALLFCRDRLARLADPASLGDPEATAFLGEDISRAVEACLSHEAMERDHLCCGNAASVEFLLEVARIGGGAATGGGVPGLASRVESCRARAAELLAVGRARGWRLLPRGYRDIPDMSLLYGRSGVGYELLRLAEPTLPPLLF